jgi:hypothetical protein
MKADVPATGLGASGESTCQSGEHHMTDKDEGKKNQLAN